MLSEKLSEKESEKDDFCQKRADSARWVEKEDGLFILRWSIKIMKEEEQQMRKYLKGAFLEAGCITYIFPHKVK